MRYCSTCSPRGRPTRRHALASWCKIRRRSTVFRTQRDRAAQEAEELIKSPDRFSERPPRGGLSAFYNRRMSAFGPKRTSARSVRQCNFDSPPVRSVCLDLNHFSDPERRGKLNMRCGRQIGGAHALRSARTARVSHPSRWGGGRMVAWCAGPTDSQPPPNWHSVPELPPPGFLEAFRQGLREFGYVEGQDIAFEIRSAEG